MNGILSAFFLLAAASYLLSCGLFVAAVRRKAARPPSAAPRRLLTLGALCHLSYLFLFSAVGHSCPMFSLHSALGIISLVGVVTYVAISRGRHLEALGGFVAALAAAFLGVAYAISGHTMTMNQPWLMAVHITANFVGGSVLLVAGCACAFYLWSARRLRLRRVLGQGPKLPPLESLDAVVHRLLWTALPLLTVGAFTGRWVLKNTDHVGTGDGLRALLAVASWLLLAVVLLLRQWGGWRGRRPAYLVLAGTSGILAVIVSYVVRALLGGSG